MILKFKQNGAWRFIDNISNIDVLPAHENQKELGATGRIVYQVGNEIVTQDLYEEAYLKETSWLK